LTTRRTVAQTHTDMKQLRSGQTVSDMKKGESSNKSGFAYHSFGLGFSCALLSVVTENTFPYKTIGRNQHGDTMSNIKSTRLHKMRTVKILKVTKDLLLASDQHCLSVLVLVLRSTL